VSPAASVDAELQDEEDRNDENRKVRSQSFLQQEVQASACHESRAPGTVSGPSHSRAILRAILAISAAC
jgi:hypothetical protein